METVLQVLLVVSCQIRDDQLVIKYGVENQSGDEVFLVNHLTKYEDGKGWIPDAQVTYVICNDNNEIEICKRVPLKPEDRLVTPRSFYVTPIPAGAKFAEELTLDLPLKEHRPYDSFIGELPAPQDVKAKLSFTLGYFPASETLIAEKVKVHGVETHRLVRRKPTGGTTGESAEIQEALLRSNLDIKHIQVIRLPTNQ